MRGLQQSRAKREDESSREEGRGATHSRSRDDTSPKQERRKIGCVSDSTPQLRIRQAAELIGVSDDTVRRWIDTGVLSATTDASGRRVVDGAELAAHARETAREIPDPSRVGRSARNRFVGLVTEVVADRVMAQVEMQCGPYRVVSLMSSEAVRELGLEPGSVAVAVVKATTVIVETPHPPAKGAPS